MLLQNVLLIFNAIHGTGAVFLFLFFFLISSSDFIGNESREAEDLSSPYIIWAGY